MVLIDNSFSERIARTSPLYDFWMSNQESADHQLRLLKVNRSSLSSDLYINEPYKWETLYQCILREIIKGDLDSVRGFKVLLETLAIEERESVLNKIVQQEILGLEYISRINKIDSIDPKRRAHPIRFAKIFISIFVNPYNLNLIKEKKYIYEKVGAFLYSLRNSF